MSRKPPKLAPVEGRDSLGSGSRKASQGPPPLKQAGNASEGNNTPRRRHFLNCNGSTPGTRRRFPSKITSVAGVSVASPGTPAVATAEEPPSNGCDDEKPPSPLPVNAPATKVNGTISNGITSKDKASESTKSAKRSKSLGFTSEGSVYSDNRSVTVNGKKTESVHPRNSVSNSASSQTNVGTATVAKRTSRLSQSSAIVPRSSKASSSTSSSSTCSIEDKTMPALVACEPPPLTHTKDTPPASLDLEETSAITEESISEEPKIIIKGDTVIKSYVDEKTGRISVFEKGMKLEVCDFGSGKWYPAKVMSIEWNKQEILVHYSNWSSRYDEWISMKSSRVRPSKNTNVVRLQFEIGEKVEAVWPLDNQKYFGTITHKLPQDMFEVTFEDGIKTKRSANQLFKVSQDDGGDERPPSLLTCRFDPEKKSPGPPDTPPSVRKKNRVKSQTEVRTPTNSKLSVSETMTSPASTQDMLASSLNRGHFSVFDPPPGELGKRKRTVHDYSALVKGRQIQRQPQTRGPRRPKSEGASVADSPSTSVLPTEEINISLVDESIDKSSTVCDTVEPVSDTKRRQKSGSTTQVPPILSPSIAEVKETPKIEQLQVEPPPVPEHKDTPLKKRKSHPPVASSSTNTTVEVKVHHNTEMVQSAETPPSTTTSTPSSSSRRTKLISTVQQGIYPPVGDAEPHNDTKTDSGFVDEMGNTIVIEQNSVDGFWKCPLNECRKNFRKDSLLKMHFKHYHPELKVADARGIQNVVQMAQARTAFDNDPSDYHIWSKHLSSEQLATTESTTVTLSEVSNEASETVEAQIPPPKKTPKASHQLKHASPEKVSPVANLPAESISSQGSPLKAEQPNHSNEVKSLPLALTRSPRQISRKRNFVLSKYSRIRASKKLNSSTPTSNDTSLDELATDNTMVTDIHKKFKGEEMSSDVTCSELGDDSTAVHSPASSLLSTSNTPSPSVSDQFSVESSGSTSGDPVFASSKSEVEPQPISSNRLTGRWTKAHLRRSLMSSNIRRPGSLHNSATLFLKKRMQFRKFMGKRGARQKRISILNRISSGRMRVILDALNQRSLKRQRFRAGRRYRDVKVDVINCVCNNKTEFGLMIQCELCLCWQHGSCFNVQSNSQLPDFYACQSCSEPEKVRLSRKYEWAESEFYRLGKLPSFPFAPNFPKEDARIMKMCTNLSSNLIEAFSMIKGLKLKERICFGQPEHPQLYEWNTERAPPQEEIQKDRFNKYFKPVLRRLLLENKSDSTYHKKINNLAESRMKLRKYADAVESARVTLKKKLGCRAAAFLDHICDRVLNDMIRARRKATADDSGTSKKDAFDLRKRLSAEQAYQRLRKLRDEVAKNPNGATSSHNANGIRRNASLNLRDYSLLKKYLKEKRSLDANIALTLTRMSKEFPDDWRNLTKISRLFIDEGRKDASQDAKLKWITSVIITYNTLRILLRQIYSEQNPQKQRNVCTDFERTTIKLFDLFSIGLAEEKLDVKKQNVSIKQRKRVRGLETLDMLNQSTPADSKSVSDLKLETGLDDARKDILKRLGTSTKPLSNKDVEDLLATASETKAIDEIAASTQPTLTLKTPSASDKPTCEKTKSSNQSSDAFLRARKVDGEIAFEFIENVNLLDAIKFAATSLEDECLEENLSLEFPDIKTESVPSTHTGIIPVPADSRITPEVCKKNLVCDILLQQQQIDTYLDKIEGQILKLSSQSKQGETVSSLKPAELSAQRTRMLQSLELVSRLCKTVIGENDAVEHAQSDDMDASETTISDYSDMDSSESDGFDNASNYSGTDTETADEGDITGDDDLLDV